MSILRNEKFEIQCVMFKKMICVDVWMEEKSSIKFEKILKIQFETLLNILCTYTQICLLTLR